MINPIKVYSVKDHSPTQDWVNHLIHPLRAYWGDGTLDWPKWEPEFKFYKKYFVITHDINDCEVGFAPLSLNYYLENNAFNKLDQLANTLDEFGKKLYIWVEGDNEIFYQKSNCIFIKYFGYKSKNNNHEIIQPGDLKTDLLHDYFSGKLQLRNKTNVPVVGFDGIAAYPYYKILFGILKNTINKILLFYP